MGLHVPSFPAAGITSSFGYPVILSIKQRAHGKTQLSFSVVLSVQSGGDWIQGLESTTGSTNTAAFGKLASYAYFSTVCLTVRMGQKIRAYLFPGSWNESYDRTLIR
ncbi:hypothetical protein V2G26_000030 [Clonostachys chloroleuca]